MIPVSANWVKKECAAATHSHYTRDGTTSLQLRTAPFLLIRFETRPQDGLKLILRKLVKCVHEKMKTKRMFSAILGFLTSWGQSGTMTATEQE